MASVDRDAETTIKEDVVPSVTIVADVETMEAKAEDEIMADETQEAVENMEGAITMVRETRTIMEEAKEMLAKVGRNLSITT